MTIDLTQLVDPEGRPLGGELLADQEVYMQELQRIFGRSWLFLGHESQVREPGDFVQTRLGYQSIILGRNAQGDLRAFRNYCRHRGYKVCHEDQRGATSFVCDLHGWTYDLDGQLIGAYGYDTASYLSLDQQYWGLIRVAQLRTHRG